MDQEIKQELMEKINKDEIRMKSKWYFISRKLGLQSSLALTVLLLILSVNLFLFYIKENRLLLSLHYGPSVWQELLHSLPYDLIMTIIISLFLLNFIIKKFDFSYKRQFVLIFSIFLVFIIIGAFVIFSTNLNTMIRLNLGKSGANIPYITDFYTHRCGQ